MRLEMNDNYDITKLEGPAHARSVELMHQILPALRCAKIRLQQQMGRKYEEEVTGMAYWIEEIEAELKLVK